MAGGRERKHRNMMRDRRDAPADAESRPPVKVTRLFASDSDQQPEPRSGHAMTLLEPSKSVLMFGGSNLETYFPEVYVLEPAQYAAPETSKSKGKRKAKANDKSSQGSGDVQAGDKTRPPFEWKKLVISRATTPVAADATRVASSYGSDVSSDSPREAADDHLGWGRDYLTMHYVPSDDEKERGFRVLVLGNVLLRAEEGDQSQDSGSFDMEEMRIDELRVNQPFLRGEWIPRTIKSMWKPRARNGHCSALVGDQLFCFGGKNVSATDYYGDFFYFDVVLDQWREVNSTGSVPYPRAFADMTVSTTQDQLFLYGGCKLETQFGGLFMYDVRSSRWDTIKCAGDKPDPRINHSLTFVSPNYLLFFGGRRTSRRNDLLLCDLSTKTWKLLAGQVTSRSRERRSKRDKSHSDSQQTSQSSSTRSGELTFESDLALQEFPSPRTAHSTIFYGAANQQQQLIIFGGYAGSNKWMNDLYLLEMTLVTVPPPAKSRNFDSTVSTRELEIVRKTLPRPHSSGSSTSTARSSSRSSAEGGIVLTDITNFVPPKSGPDVGHVTPQAGSSYTPAAVAARRRRLAEAEAKHNSPSMKKKRLGSAESESSSQSQSQNSSQSKTPPAEPVAGVSEGRSSSPELIGLQTTMIQLLQQQQRMDHNIARLTSIVRDERSNTLRETLMNQQVFMQQQNELLEDKLDSMTRRYDELTKKLELFEEEKLKDQERVAWSEAQAYMHKKNLEELIPQLRAEVLETIEKSGRSNHNAIRLLETKISAIHDMLEEIRHSSGERTETDDSPQKKDRCVVCCIYSA